MNNKETFEEFWYRYEWLNRGKNHKESALLAFNEVIKPFLDESERLKVFEDRYKEEYEIVKRIWEIIGFDEYNSKGCPKKSIFDYVEGYKAEIERLKGVVDALELDLENIMGDRIDQDAEIERLEALITELADALEEDEDFIEHQFAFSKEKIKNKFRPLIQRAKDQLSEP